MTRQTQNTRYRWLWLAALFLLLLFTTCDERKVQPEFAGSDKYRLVWNDDPATTVTIGWDQREGLNPEVFYDQKDHGRKDWKYEQSAIPTWIHSKYGMNTHFVKLTGLTPNQNYFFILKDSKGVSRRYWFRTAPGRPEAFTFVAGGDTKSLGDPLEAGRASNRLIAKLRPLFVLFNGDFTTGDGTNAAYWQQWLTEWHEMTTTKDGRMIPLIPVHGNHERGNPANLVYLFNAPFQEEDSTQIFYGISLGENLLHLTVLNSEMESGGTQRNWLERDLQAHQHFTFKIAAYHKPFWPHTSGKPERAFLYNQWAGLFYQYRLSLSIDADSHMDKVTYPLKPDTTDQGVMGFIRDDETGTVYIGEGSWGARPRQNDDDKPWTYYSGSYNQFKWIHVIPEKGPEEAYMKIHAVITASYDTEGQLSVHDAETKALTEKNRFKIPAGIRLVRFPNERTWMTVPFRE